MFALAVIAETDLISALPRRFVTMHAARFGVLSLDAPLPLPGFRLNAVAPKVAMMVRVWHGSSICLQEWSILRKSTTAACPH